MIKEFYSLKNKPRWFSLLIIIEIVSVITFYFRKTLRTNSEINFVFPFLIPFFLILIIFFIFFLCTFINNELSRKILNVFTGENKVLLYFTYAISAVLILGSLLFFSQKYIVHYEVREILNHLAVLGYVVFWEIVIFLSFTRKDTKDNRKYWIGLPILIAINYFYWNELVNVYRFLEPYLKRVYSSEAKIIFEKYKWWELMLPLEELRGFWQYVIILTYYMERILGISGVWHFNQLVLILVSFFLSWKVFRSEIFSYFLSICLVLGTHFFHVFQYSSITGFYLIHALFLVLMYFAYEYIRKEEGGVIYLIASIPVLIFSAILMEGWLDFFASVWLILIFLFFFFRKRKMDGFSKRIIPIFILYNIAAIIYVYIKFTYISFPHTSGESAVVFAYGTDYFWRIIEDLVSNYITHLYIVLTNFLPPGLITSNALYEYFEVMQEQRSLIYNHYLFFWRYAAGALTVTFFYFFVKVIKKTLRDEKTHTFLPLAIFLIMVAVNSPTHTIVQMRIFKTMPLLGYQVEQGILGLSLSIAYLMYLLQLKIKNNRVMILISMGVFLLILYSSIHKPNYLWHMVRVTGLERQGPYPLPINSVISMIKSFFNVFRN